MDEAENIVQIVYNSKARESFLNLDADKVDQFYHALQNFAEILHSPQNLVEINLRAGDAAKATFKVNQAYFKPGLLLHLALFEEIFSFHLR